MDEVVERLFKEERFDWVGVYVLEGDTLVLGPYRGPNPAGHERIPFGEGVCGAVAESRLATDVCFCCKTASLVPPTTLATSTLPGDVIVAWRHIYPNSERDIALAVRTARTGIFAPPIPALTPAIAVSRSPVVMPPLVSQRTTPSAPALSADLRHWTL